jgi:two-component system sensor histidine kinase YesM
MKFISFIRLSFKQSVRLRLTFYFVLAILPLISISQYSIIQSQKILQNQTSERTRVAMIASLTYIDQFMESIDQLSLNISNNSEMNGLLNQAGSETHMIFGAKVLLAQLSNYNITNRFITDIWIYNDNLGMVISANNGGKRMDVHNLEWYTKTIAVSSSLLNYSLKKSNTASNPNDPVNAPNTITMTRVMGFNSTEPSKHIIGVTINLDTLVQFCKELLTTQETQLNLIDPEQKLIVSTNGDLQTPYQIQDNNKSYLNEDAPKNFEKMFVIKILSEKSKWSMVLAQPEKVLTNESDQLQRFTFWVIGISCLLALSISWIVYIGISSPISNLLSGIREIRRGNLNVQLKHNRSDEFGFLTESFNQMAEQQRKYISDIFEQQVEKTRTELKFLQSQINPHFLYNTLDSIYACAVNYDAEEICEMVLNLSRFFRLSLNKGRETFTLEETIEHLYYYIRIQQIRFTDHFSCEFRIPESCKALHLQKLILQPLVENAIIHGLEKSHSGGKLIISADRTDQFLLLTVQNNGSIPANRLARIQRELTQVTPSTPLEKREPTTDFFGILNVIYRLKLYYGNHADLRIDSNEQTGTTTTVVLPLELCIIKSASFEGEVGS